MSIESACPNLLTNRKYEYDSVGNRLKTEIANESWTYNANHQLLSYGTKDNLTTYVYDENGSTISKTGKNGVENYVYNVAGRLSEIKRNGKKIASYYYNPFGMRLWKEVNGKRTYFLYANEGLVAEYNHAGQLIQSYQHVPGAMWGTSAVSMIKNGEASFYQHDQIGTPNLLTSKSGRVMWQGKMDAFGEVFSSTKEIDSPLRFAGQYFDKETGLHQNYFRDYNFRTGRYMQSDPIGLAGGINVYGYANQNPIYFSDPIGLKSLCDAMKEINATSANNPFLDGSDFDSDNLAREYVPSGVSPEDDSQFNDHRNGLSYDVQYIQVAWSITKTYGPGAANLMSLGYMIGPILETEWSYFYKENLPANLRGLQLGIYGANNFDNFNDFYKDLCPNECTSE